MIKSDSGDIFISPLSDFFIQNKETGRIHSVRIGGVCLLADALSGRKRRINGTADIPHGRTLNDPKSIFRLMDNFEGFTSNRPVFFIKNRPIT
ncbi:MAG TPA: hypothetical protein H9671_05590 [Firmicutes bacterium]|nr:hypothetical protein [Bacillota bacterium]